MSAKSFHALPLAEAIRQRLRCPSCREPALAPREVGLACQACHVTFPRVDGVLDLARGVSLPPLRMYEDPHYQKWRTMLADAQDYFYQHPLVAWVQNAGHRRIRAIVEKIRPEAVLDIGCGDGAHLPFVRDRRRYCGLDIDQPSLVKLGKRFPDTCALRADGFNLPFQDGSFDCIINVYNLEHMVFLDLALEEMERVLAPGGLILVSVPSVDSPAARLARWFSSRRQFQSNDLDYDRVSDLEHVNMIGQLEKSFRRHFTIRERTLFPFAVPLLSLSLIATYTLQSRTKP